MKYRFSAMNTGRSGLYQRGQGLLSLLLLPLLMGLCNSLLQLPSTPFEDDATALPPPASATFTPTPSPFPSFTFTPIPSASPTSSPMPSPSASPTQAATESAALEVPVNSDIALPQSASFRNEDLLTTIDYPDTWLLSDSSGVIILANSQAALDIAGAGDLVLTDGQAFFALFIFPPIDVDLSPEALLPGLLESFADEVLLGEPQPIIVVGREGLRVPFTSLENEGGAGEFYLLLLENGFTMLAIPAAFDYDAFQETALAMLASVQVTLLE